MAETRRATLGSNGKTAETCGATLGSAGKTAGICGATLDSAGKTTATAPIRRWRDADPGIRARDIEKRIERSMERRRSVDPRVQIAALVMMNLTATTPTPPALDVAEVLAASALAAYCERMGTAAAWLAGYGAAWVAAGLCAISGDPVLSSVGAILMMLRKMYAIAVLAVTLVSTVRVGELACALQRLHVPRAVVIALSVALRFFPTLAAEASAVADAMKLRHIRLSPRNVLLHPRLTLERFAVPLVLRVSVVVDEMSRAATVRGIDSKHPRSSLYALRMGATDWLFLLAFAALALAAVALAGDSFTVMGLF